MSDDLRERLRRLGVHKGTARLKPSAPGGISQGGALQAALGGREIETSQGPAYLVEEHFELDYVHGNCPLSSALDLPGDVLSQLAYEPLWGETDLSRAAFIDTETTGLAGGTGTLAFLIGVGRFGAPLLTFDPFDSAQGKVSRFTFDVSRLTFHVLQFFLRHPGEEAVMLAALDEVLADCNAVVTFNGRGFDLPLLQARFTLNRMLPSILAVPHLDLLLPARRVWRNRLPSCALSSLEAHVLGVQRDQADVPGFLIPQMYFDYLKTGDASDMPRVLYHNTQDILSMVTLVARLGRIFADPLAETALDPADLVSLARWYDNLGLSDKAEAAYRFALERPMPAEIQAVAWQHLGLLLKRQERYEEARRAWEQLAAIDAGIFAHVELAKHYEWRARERDIGVALEWTQAALERVEGWLPGFRRDQAQGELLHRKRRLERKSVKRQTLP